MNKKQEQQKKAKEVVNEENMQSEKERKRIEKNKRERILSKERRELRDEQNGLMLLQIQRLEGENDELRNKIDGLFQELSTLLPQEQVQQVKEILSVQSEETKVVTDEIIKLRYINQNLVSRIERLSEEFSKMMPGDQFESLLVSLIFKHSALCKTEDEE